jgi:hypothetical protein
VLLEDARAVRELDRKGLRHFTETRSNQMRKEERPWFEAIRKKRRPRKLWTAGASLDRPAASEVCIAPIEATLRDPVD